jgi:LacI family transcriptional regulator
MSKKTVTIYDVKKEAGVSIATVSRVINDTGQVKPETKQKVLDAIEKLDYRPNAVAQGLASNKTTTIGVYAPEIVRLSVAQAIQGIVDISHMYNYSIILETDDPTSQVDFWESFMKKKVDGVLIMSDEITEEEIKSFEKDMDIPIVLVSTHTEQEFASVSIDYEKATYEVTQMLVENGRKKVALVGSSIYQSINLLKEAGYRKAIEEAGLEVDVINFPNSYTKMSKLAFDIVGEYDGIIATRDSIAVAMVNAACEKEIDVPNDLEIIGFDNTKYARMSRPALSSVAYSTYDLGAVAMRLLTKLLDNENVEDKKVVLPHYFKKRGTTL